MNLNANGAITAIVALIVGVAVATLVLIFVGSLGGQTYEQVEADIDAINDYVPVTADTFTALNGTAVALDNTFIESGTLTLENATNVIALTNFTIDYDAGTVLLKFATYNNTAFTANYTYDRQDVKNNIKNSIISSFSALEDTGSYLPIVVLAVVIVLVMALVLGMGGITAGRGGGGTL